MNTVLEALTNELGIRMRKVEMEYSRRHRYVQEFEFMPGSDFHRDLDELEASRVELILQIDRRAKGLGGLFSEALEMDEDFVRVSFTDAEINQGVHSVADKLRITIQQFT